MRRAAIALTTLLTLVGVAVIAGYLLVFAASPDRAARAVPAGTAAYATVYLQPSSGQKMNLAALLGRVPGFADAAGLDQKIHEIAARLLGDAGLDYERDLRPWIGNQLAMAARPQGADPAAAGVLLLVAIQEGKAEEAAAALDRMAADRGMAPAIESYEGGELHVADGLAWALLDGLVVIAADPADLRAAVDADAGRATALADDAGFGAAMRRLPADHLGAVYLDLAGFAGGVGVEDQLGGYSSVSLALVAERTGLRLAGMAPFDADAADPAAREAFALASEPSSLPAWMPADTQAELVVFGLSQTFQAAEDQLGDETGTGEVADAVAQLRAVAALVLGISLDDDVLPLFDRETAIAVAGLEEATPSVHLLLRPSDADGARAALDRLRDALADAGAAVDSQEVGGIEITTVDVPDLGSLAYAVRDGVIVAGLDADDVAAAIAANADGTSLADSPAYQGAWELAGTRGGNEAYLHVASLADVFGDGLGLDGDARDILQAVEALAMTAPASETEQNSEFHVVLTVR